MTLLNKKARGKRFYKIEDREIYLQACKQVSVNPNNDNELEINSKQEKFLKEFVDTLTMDKKLKELDEVLSSLTTTFREDNQGTPQWKFERLGFISGSNNPFTTNGKLVPSWKEIASQKAVELFYKNISNYDLKEEIEITDLAGVKKTPAMKRGNRLEVEARKKYIAQTGYIPSSYGFCTLNQYHLGSSVDNIVTDPKSFDDIYAEYKSPSLKTYLDNLKYKKQVSKYYAQLQIGMLVMGVKKADLVIFYPQMRLQIERVEFDKEYIANLIESLKAYELELERGLELLYFNMDLEDF